MPCYDHRNSAEYGEEKARSELEPKIAELESMLCACLNFNRANGNIHDLLNYAKKNSESNLSEFAAKHAKEDSERVAILLRGYFSQDELNLIKQIIK